MKVKMTFKDPDRYVHGQAGEEIPDEAAALVRRYVEFDEYVTIEFDTETKTATVVPLE
ncbi:MAG TPA: hypothetical protein VNZ53_27520 [Steroidobacteraceae bacterium]|jgi:hypothetical protein|nr:hypothetical protein [Steroidobacteraceae bacterium]